MTTAEAIVFLDRWIRNSAVDAFTNDRLNTLLHFLINGGIPGTYSTYDDFEAAIIANPDAILIGFVAQDDELTGEENVVLMRIPGIGTGQIAFDLLTEE